MNAHQSDTSDNRGLEHRRQTLRAVGKVVRTLLYHTGIFLYYCGLSGWITRLSPNRVRTVLYHAVEDNPGPYTAQLNVNVTPKTFERHLRYYSSHFNVGSVSDIAAGKIGKPALAITFDDGYASVESNALPLLESYGLPATVYLIGSAVRGDIVWVNRLNYALNVHPRLTSRMLTIYPALATLHGQAVIQHVQQEFSPDDIEHLMNRLETEIPAPPKNLKLFSDTRDVQAMQRRGITFGFHTNNHYNLERCNDKQLDSELNNSQVRQLLNSNTFAYPFGYFDSRATRRLEQQAYARLLTVAKAPTGTSPLHSQRHETFEITAAGVFAQLEIVEPAMGLLRKLLQLSQIRITLGLDTQSARDFADENRLPETSKPR